MKKLIPTAAVLLLSFSLSAQYKKAGFFEKEGRTYELGTQYYMMGKENGNMLGYKICFGKDKDGNRFFSSWDLQYIPSHEYTFTSVDENEAPVTVSGTSKSIFVYGVNYGYHILKNEAENKKMIQPFVGAGFNILLAGGIKSESYSPTPTGYLKKNTSEQTISMGFNGGVGCFVNFAPKWAVKLQGGYSYQLNYSASNWSDEIKPFYVFDSYSFASLGVLFRLVKD